MLSETHLLKILCASAVMVALLAAGGCAALQASRERVWTHSNIESFTIHELSYDQLPLTLTYDGAEIQPFPSVGNTDEEGVPITPWTDLDGVNHYHYHPVVNAQVVLRLLDVWVVSGYEDYLSTAEFLARKMLQKADVVDGAIFFPYEFEYRAYGSEKTHLGAPWYSGLAQGLWLSAYVRLYNATGDAEYLEIAEQVFESFDTRPGDEVWIAGVDEDGYYWIEEYPMQPWDHTLNGFLEAVVTGLYDYHMVKQDAESESALRATLTTIKHYLPEYRVENGISLYSLNPLVPPKQLRSYHTIHTRQLLNLWNIAKDDRFRDMAAAFYRDAVAETAARLGDYEGVPRVNDGPQDSGPLLEFVGSVVGAGITVTTTLENLFPESTGSLAFWFSPQWDARDENHHYILDTRGNGGDRLLYLYYDRDQDALVWRGGQSSPLSFESGEWLYIVLVWSKGEDEPQIYVNGEPRGRGAPMEVGETLVLGNNWAGSFPCDCVMGQLVALERMLYLEEIEALYTLSVETLPETQ